MTRFRHLLTLLLLPLVSPVYGQDTITMLNGEKINAKVVSIDKATNTLIYQSSPDSATRSAISTTYVRQVTYANGSSERVAGSRYTKYVKGHPFDSTRHFVSVNVAALISSLFSASFEHIFSMGHLGVRPHFTLGSGKSNEYHSRFGTKAAFGIDLNIYPYNGNYYPGGAKYFFGLSLENGTFNYDYEYFDYKYDEISVQGNPPYTYTVTTPIFTTSKIVKGGSQTTFLIKNGILFRPSQHFNISTTLGLGRVWFNEFYRTFEPGKREKGSKLPHPYGYQNKMTARLEINLGYKFR